MSEGNTTARWELEKVIVEYANASKADRSFEIVQAAITRLIASTLKEGCNHVE